MKVNLSESDLYLENEIDFSKKINFVFGKNGTGKSTLVRLCVEQYEHEFDIRVFQGFKSVVGEDNVLNAVLLGEHNNLIDNEIKKINGEIDDYKAEKKEYYKSLSHEIPDNIYRKYEDIKSEYSTANNSILNFYKKKASIIKNKDNPRIVGPNYNTNNFQSDLKNAKRLDDKDKEKYEKLLTIETKLAKKIIFPNETIGYYVDEVNKLLSKKIEEKIIITRINNGNKKKFAEEGLHIHSIGDECAFCGSTISGEVIEELTKYFSVDEVQNLRKEISECKHSINTFIGKISSIKVNIDSFYPKFLNNIITIENNITKGKQHCLDSLNQLIDLLTKKEQFLFDKIESLNITINSKLQEAIEEYNNIVEENNNIDLEQQKTLAKSKLLGDEIFNYLEEFDYYTKNNDLFNIKEKLAQVEKEIELVKGKIISINNNIKNLEDRITQLESETRSEKILADNINKKLNLYCNFVLDYVDDINQKGFYRIKSLINEKYRNVNELSTGEKNIVGFLYFIEKLSEISDKQTKKIIIFDDPMTSNDDTMQYLIIEELQILMKKICSVDKDKFILLTHNTHFYLNVKYGRKYKDDNFIRIVSDGVATKITKLSNLNEDYKTNYESLWFELKYLYNDVDASPQMIINPIRRINETFYKFNSIQANDFYKNVNGAKKLFNVNSHSIDDFEADLNGKSKSEIIMLMRSCFENNSAIDHFNTFWNED